MTEWLSERPAPRAIGALLGLVVAGYAAWTAMAGGLVDPSRPMSQREVQEGIFGYLASKQSGEKVFEALNGRTHRRGDHGIDATNLSHAAFGDFAEVLAKHKAYAFKKARPSEPMVFDIARYEAEERTALGSQADITAESVERKTALYESGRAYEIIGASREPAEAVFREYIEAAVRAQWLVSQGSFDSHMKRGWFAARRKGGTLLVGVWTESVFPGADGEKFPTTTCVQIEGRDLKW